MSVERVIEIAKADLGYTESPPGSNNTKYGEAYGLQGQPWCVIALWFWFREAGESAAFFGGAKTASCGKLLRWYREQGQTVPVEQVQPGDIVILNFHGTQDTEHCGLVIGTAEVVCKDGTYDQYKRIITVEGNTTPGEEGSQDNGGCVAQKRRYPSQIVAVCRPKCKPEPVVVDDVSGHWAEKEMRWAAEKGLLKGYSDGTMKPDKPITRAELAVILKRLEDGRE